MTDLAMRILLSAQDTNASSIVNNLASSLAGIGKTAGPIGIAGAAIAAIGVAAVGVTVASVKMAGDFQAGMTSLETGAGEAHRNIQMVSQGILQLSVDTATSTQQLTSGMYMIESANYHGAAALAVLKAAAEGAKVGNADLGTVANALTTVMTDYGIKATNAATAMNFLTAIVQNGKTTMQDLAGAMSQILPTASAVHVGLTDVGAAMATMTGEGVPAANAATYLRQMLISLSAPAKAGATSLKDIGLTAQQVSTSMKQSLPATLQMIMQHLQETYKVGSPEYVNALKNIAGGSKQMQGMLDLTGAHLKTFESNVANVSGVMNQNKGVVAGWSAVQGDFNFKVDQSKQALNVLMIQIGTALLPVLSKLLTAVTPLITKFADWLVKSHAIENGISLVKTGLKNLENGIQTASNATGKIVKALQDAHTWFQKNEPVIKNVATAIGVAYTPAIIKAGVESVISGTKIAASFIANVVKSGVEGVVAGAKLAGSFVVNLIRVGAEGWQAAAKLGMFIASMIKTGVEAVIAAAKVAASFVASMVKAGVEAVAAGAKVVASFVASMITAGAQAVIAAAKIAASFVVSLVRAAAQAVVTGATMLASLVPAIISVIVEATIAAVTAIPALIIGFIGWAATAGAAAVATIAATWPVLLIIAAIALLVIGIILLVQHWNQVVTFLQTTWQRFTSWLINSVTSLARQAVNWGRNIIQGIINGINSMLGAIGNAASNVANTIKHFLGFASPTKLGPGATADKWAPNFIRMYSIGLQSGVPQMQHAVSAVAAPLTALNPGTVRNVPSAGGAGSGVYAPTVNVHVHGARSQNEAQQIADKVDQILAKKYRGQYSSASLGVY